MSCALSVRSKCPWILQIRVKAQMIINLVFCFNLPYINVADTILEMYLDAGNYFFSYHRNKLERKTSPRFEIKAFGSDMIQVFRKSAA